MPGRMRALLLQFGAVPPASGEARSLFLLERGTEAARDAARSYRAALAAIEDVAGPLTLPFAEDPFAHPDRSDPDERLRRWDELRTRLLFAHGWTDLPGEAQARAALRHGVDAYRDLTGSPKETAAHVRMHRYGEFVSGLHHCFLRWDEKERVWYDRCALAHAHNPNGLSVGYTSTWLCSICREDITECAHHGLRPWPVVADRYERSDGTSRCTVCDEPRCDHKRGIQYEVFQTGRPINPVLHEAAIVSNPREPRARFAEMEIDPQPPPPRHPKGRRCLSCLNTCGGGHGDRHDY